MTKTREAREPAELEKIAELKFLGRGDYILIKVKGKDNYTFGIFEEIAESMDSENRPIFRLKFEGDSYVLISANVLGTEVPGFAPRYDAIVRKKSRYFGVRNIEAVVSGAENIVRFLQRQENKRYKGHADLIRKIAKNKKK